MPSLIWRTDLNNGPVLVDAGRIVTENGDIVAATGNRVFIFVPDDSEYRQQAVQEVQAEITALAVLETGLEVRTPESFVVSTTEKIILLGNRQGSVVPVFETGPEAGADFSDIAAGDLDNDGIDEIVVAASGQDSIYVYRLTTDNVDGLRLELAGIRAVPGTPRLVEIFLRPGRISVIGVVYEKGGTSGVALYTLTEEGFEAGPVLEGLPFRINAFASGNFHERAGSELALGGVGGMVWLLGTDGIIEVIMVTDSLGTAVSALTASDGGRLIAGTPEGNIFIFNYPAGKSPDLAFGAVEGVNDLAAVSSEKIVAGTVMGGIQVWSISKDRNFSRYIVKPGDTLWNIAKKTGVPIEKILSMNKNIKNHNLILPGQVIKIPGGGIF